ncbi:MAG: hypothetical protein JXD18_06415 [Anaerolineae bacterium]|nr:hypothetical protein [Anaerolineae bacterium]
MIIKVVTTPLAPLSLLSIIYATTIYMLLSRKLGMVTKMKPYYRGFVASMVFTLIAMMAYIIRNAAYLARAPETMWLTSAGFGLAFFHIPLLIGTVINLALIWKYWAWLLSAGK